MLFVWQAGEIIGKRNRKKRMLKWKRVAIYMC